jgi:hypothetical protein
MQQGHRTVSGVFVADDFRGNLIIDRYDSSLLWMRGAKTAAMRSENSEDVLTWNVFRSLAQVDPAIWFPRLFERSFGASGPTAQLIGLQVWKRVEAPPALRLVQKDEGESEIDILIECEAFVWVIEAKFRSDVSERTTNNAERDQVLRNLDVGSWYAGVRDFYFSLLVLDAATSGKGAALIYRYSGSHSEVVGRLPHRTDKLGNLKGIGLLRWSDCAAVLRECAESATHEDERLVASRAVAWLTEKGVGAR